MTILLRAWLLIQPFPIVESLFLWLGSTSVCFNFFIYIYTYIITYNHVGPDPAHSPSFRVSQTFKLSHLSVSYCIIKPRLVLLLVAVWSSPWCHTVLSQTSQTSPTGCPSLFLSWHSHWHTHQVVFEARLLYPIISSIKVSGGLQYIFSMLCPSLSKENFHTPYRFWASQT